MFGTFKKAFKSWFADDPFTQSAAAGYYAIFALPGLMIVAMTIAAFFLDQQDVESMMMNYMRDLWGVQTAQSVNEMIINTKLEDRGLWPMVAGIATLVFGSTGLFAQLQRSLNRVWEVDIKKSAPLWLFVKARLTSFGLVLIIGFLLLISLSASAILAALSAWLTSKFSPEFVIMISLVHFLFSFFTISLLFALIFKILPDAKVHKRDAFMGGVVSTIFFLIGEYLLGFYFAAAQPQSGFGAAGSIVLLMIWVFYSCMILFLGAEFAKIYAQERLGRKVEPIDIAKKKIRKDDV